MSLAAPISPRGSVKSLPIRKRVPSLRLFEISMEQIDLGYSRLGQFHRRLRFEAGQVAYPFRARIFPKRISVSSFWPLPKAGLDPISVAHTAVM
jgi:hypothetical protein